MLTFIAVVAAFLALLLLALSPAWGIVAILIVRPLVDTQWETPVLAGLKLTEIVSATVPILVAVRLWLAPASEPASRTRILNALWIAWAFYVGMFSLLIMFGEGVIPSLNIFFRHINGVVAFFMVQAFLSSDKGTKRYVTALVLAGLFPLATGLYESLTGHHWKVTYGEGGVIRSVGLYHDAITIRYYALQTIMGLLLATGLYLGRRRLFKLLALVYGLAATFVIQRTYSKAGTLTLVSWITLWPLLQRQWRTVTAIGIAAVLASVYYAHKIVDNIGFIFQKEFGALSGTEDVERSFSGRWYGWQEMMRQWYEFDTLHQLFGSGVTALGAHNDYLQILYHGGLVGLSLYIALLLTTFGRIVTDLYRRVDVFSVAALLALVMWLVDTIGLVPSAYPGYQWFIWGTIGLCLYRRQLSETKPIDARVHTQSEPAWAHSLMR